MLNLQKKIANSFLDEIKGKFSEARLTSYISDYDQEVFNKHQIDFTRGYSFPLIPFYIFQNHLSQIQTDLTAVCRLVMRIPEVVFQNDLNRYSKALKCTAKERRWIECSPATLKSKLIARPDCFLTEDSVKIAELNISSGVGGIFPLELRSQFYERMPYLRKSLKDIGIKAEFKSPMRHYLRSLIAAEKPMLLVGPSKFLNDEGRLNYLGETRLILDTVSGIKVLPIEDVDAHTLEKLNQEMQFASIYKQASDYTILNAPSVSWRALLAFLNRPGLVTYNHNVHHLFDNKINLAILQSESFLGKLTKNEADVVMRCIPKTRLVTSQVVNEIECRKDNVVLKKGNSQAGKHITIGSECSRLEFDRAIRLALEQGDWILQEKIDSPLFSNVFKKSADYLKLDVPILIRPFIQGKKIIGVDVAASVFSDEDRRFLNTPGYKTISSGAMCIVKNLSAEI